MDWGLAILIVLVSVLLIMFIISILTPDEPIKEGSVGFIRIDNIDVYSNDTIIVYDNRTNIVYQEFRSYGGYSSYTPYIAENGLPYKYNPTTCELEEIPYTVIQNDTV